MAWKTSYYHYDAVGSTRMLTDDSQNPRASYPQTAFGEQLVENITVVNPFRFIGRLGYYFDPGTGLFQVRQRAYNPVESRWLSQDPSQDDENVFRYVHNNPLLHVDAHGLQEQKIIDRSRAELDTREENAIGSPIRIRSGDLSITLTIDADPTKTITGRGGWPKRMPGLVGNLPMYTGPGIIIKDTKAGTPCGDLRDGKRVWISAVRVEQEYLEAEGERRHIPAGKGMWPKHQKGAWYVDEY
jgi:RHS repeat-associated protein